MRGYIDLPVRVLPLIMGATMVLFFLAALIEGFLSPSPVPYVFKALVATLSCGLMLFYFVLLGYPREDGHSA